MFLYFAHQPEVPKFDLDISHNNYQRSVLVIAFSRTTEEISKKDGEDVLKTGTPP
jgi:hypothetical protein